MKPGWTSQVASTVTGLGKDRLFPVPGNHDVDRRRISRGARGIAVVLIDRHSANEVLAGDAERRLMLAVLAEYSHPFAFRAITQRG